MGMISPAIIALSTLHCQTFWTGLLSIRIEWLRWMSSIRSEGVQSSHTDSSLVLGWLQIRHLLSTVDNDKKTVASSVEGEAMKTWCSQHCLCTHNDNIARECYSSFCFLGRSGSRLYLFREQSIGKSWKHFIINGWELAIGEFAKPRRQFRFEQRKICNKLPE